MTDPDLSVPGRPHLTVREKQLLGALNEAIGALEALDELLTDCAPDTFKLDQYKVWEEARRVRESCSALHSSVISRRTP